MCIVSQIANLCLAEKKHGFLVFMYFEAVILKTSGHSDADPVLSSCFYQAF